MTRTHRVAMLSCPALLAVGAAACGSSRNDDNGGCTVKSGATAAPAKGNADTYIVGTTDPGVALDPAAAYDLRPHQLIGNISQNLLSFPAGGNKPEPGAAESCEFSDP